MAGLLWLVDLDDTCGAISWAYASSLGKLYSTVCEELKVRVPDMANFQRVVRDINKSVVEDRGYTHGMWGHVLRDVYIYFLTDAGHGPNPETIDIVYEMGMGVYDADFPSLDGTRMMLKFTGERGDRRVIVTNSDLATQLRKLEDLEILGLVDDVSYCERGKHDEIQMLARERGEPEKVFVVGDNPLKDGHPVVGLGRFLLVDRGPHFDNGEGEIELPPTRKIWSPSEIVDHYEKLQRPETWKEEYQLLHLE